MIKKLSLILLIAILSGIGTGAQAQWCNFGPWLGSACWGYGCQCMYDNMQIPYFSAHPPVYYNYRITSPHGFSQFSYPPYPQPVSDTYSRPGQPESEPSRIENPFVEPSDEDGVTLHRKSIKHPQIVYPAGLAKVTR